MNAVQVRYGGRGGAAFRLEASADLVVVRTHDQGPVSQAVRSEKARRLLDGYGRVNALKAVRLARKNDRAALAAR